MLEYAHIIGPAAALRGNGAGMALECRDVYEWRLALLLRPISLE
jgi:hypothetical protein